jgi:hypothetical protein
VTLHDLITQAKPVSRSVEICLRGDLHADLEDATRDLAAAIDAKDQPATEAATARVTDVRRAMADSVVTVRFEAMPRARWLALIAEHAPRDGNTTDERLGFNTDALYAAAIRGSWVSPEATPADLDLLLERVNDGQFSDLADAAFSVNARSVFIPFGWRGSKPTPD